MKAKIQKTNTRNEIIIPSTPQWASRKSEANTYIASAVQHMRTTENIDDRTYSITAHTDVRRRGAKDYLSNKSICISLYKAISSFIASTYQGEKTEIPPKDKPGLVASKDVSGTKWDANRGNFDATNIPHIHAALILPFWITDWDTEIAFMHSLKRVIEQVDGVKSCNLGTSSGSVLVKKFTPNKPLWWLIDYNTKARRFSDASGEFEPLVFPYHLQLEKYEISKARTDLERERFHRKRNNILAGQIRAVRNLTYNPRLFYRSEVCCDFSISHKALLASNVLLKSEDYTPSERELNRIVEWRGKFDNSNFGTEVPPSTANTSPPGPVLDAQKPSSWGVSLDGYVDESACRVALGKAVLPPTAQQLQMMPPDFGHYPSEHAWLKSQDCFHQRLGFWRLHFAIRTLARFQSIYR